MRASERQKLERELLRRGLSAAREALHAFPAEKLKELPKSEAKARIEVWVGALRNLAIYEISTLLGDVPLGQLDPRNPGPFEPDGEMPLHRARYFELKRLLGVPGAKS